MASPTDNLTKRYYSIGEVATMFDVSKSLVRFWEQEFDYLRPYKSSKGERRFTPDNVRQFEEIHYLVKRQGYTLAGAKRMLKEQKSQLQQKKDALKKLEELKEFLEELKARV